MLDGTIAALHSDPAPSPLMVERLAAQLARSEDELSSMLRADGALGARFAVVRPYREGIQWNPADDLCVACSVAVDARVPPGALEGEVLEVAPL